MSTTSHHKELGRLWDAMQASGSLNASGIDPDEVAVIAALHRAQDVPPADHDTISAIWKTINLETTPGAMSHPGPMHASVAVPVAQETPASTRSWNRLLRMALVAVSSGFLTGFVVLGGGGRVAMRLAAMLSADELQGATTENLETVGEMTLSGTFGLMMTGGMIGAALGLGYLLIAHLLPDDRGRRMGLSGFFYFAVCGFAALEGGNNTDYERFGIAGLNICIFTLLPLFYGLAIPAVFSRVDRLMAGARPGKRSPATILAVMATPLIIFAGAFLLLMPPLQLFFLVPAVAMIGDALARRMPASPRLAIWSDRLALAVPAIAGLVFTVLAVTRIL